MRELLAERGNGAEATYRRSGWWGGAGVLERYAETVRDHPDRAILWDSRGHGLTNSELWGRAERFSADLRARGVEPGHVVLIVLPNWVEWQIAHLAIRLMKAIPANAPIKTDATTLAHMINLVSARCVIGAEAFASVDTRSVLENVAKAADHVVDVLTISRSGKTCWFANTETAPARKPEDPRLDHLMFTSSTTGLPKAVMHSCDGLNAFHQTVVARFPIEPDAAIFMGAPMGHSIGAIHGGRMSLYFGVPLILQEEWNPTEALRIIEAHNCTLTAAATPFLKDLLDAEPIGHDPKLASLRYFLCGGAQVPPVMLEMAEKEFPRTFVTVLWGMTEGGYITCAPGVTPRAKLLNTVGRPSDGLEIRIVDADRSDLGAGTEGELWVRGPAMFYGYFAQPDLTASLFDDQGFFSTGDLATVDADGYVRITGRSKDLVIRGGVNISPVPIEDILSAHPRVTTVAVVGYPDERLGERICAVFGPGAEDLKLADVTAFCGQKGLGKHHWPEFVRHIPEMPMTPAGKIRKNDVRRWLAGQIAGSDEDFRVRLGDIDVSYRRAGSGAPCLLIHGLAEDHGSWAAVQDEIREYATYAYDLRGHGATSLGDAQGTLEQLGRDLIAFLEAVTGPAICVGFSLGGTVVLWAAARRPDLIPGAVVIGTSSKVGRAAVGFFNERIGQVQNDRAAFERGLAGDTAAQLARPRDDLDAIVRRRLAAVGAGSGYVNAARAMIGLAEHPLSADLAAITQPVTVIGGAEDQFCPRKAAEMILSELPHACYDEIPHAGHLMCLDQPAAYIAAIRRALRRRT